MIQLTPLVTLPSLFILILDFLGKGKGWFTIYDTDHAQHDTEHSDGPSLV